MRLNREDIGVRPFIRLREFGGTPFRDGGVNEGGRKMRDWVLHDRGPTSCITGVTKRRRKFGKIENIAHEVLERCRNFFLF